MTNVMGIKVLRDLAKQYMDCAAHEKYNELRELWRKHNSLIKTRPLLFVGGGGWTAEIIRDENLACETPLLRALERTLREGIYRDTIGDDTVMEPYYVVGPEYIVPQGGVWGVQNNVIWSEEHEGRNEYLECPIKCLDDMTKMVVPIHKINEEATARKIAVLRDAVGDILPIVSSRWTAYTMWHGDIATDLAKLLGMEEMMVYMHEQPEFIHKMCAFMRDGVLKAQKECEDAGDFKSVNHDNQSMRYSKELCDPTDSDAALMRKDLWIHMSAQEFAVVSPEMHDEFMLEYQIPIISQYGLSAYGCCEDLTRKIGILRRIPNLRRIAVVPLANVDRSAELIGADYVYSWRPNPTDVSLVYTYDKTKDMVAHVAKVTQNGHMDATLKDIRTVQHDPERMRQWASAFKAGIGM